MNGASQHVDGKGYSVCLDLLGNFASYHTEWGNSASGWSPTNTLGTILIQLQGVLNDMLDCSPNSVESTRKNATDLVCSCGHTGSKPFPPLKTGAKEAVQVADWKKQYEELLKETEALRIKAQAYDELVSKGVISAAPAVVAAAAAAAAVPAVSKPSFAHLVCAVTGSNPDSDPKEIFGFGVEVSQQGTASSPGEILSKTAFDGGVRRSSTNESFSFFLPIFVSNEHFSNAKACFRSSIEAIYAAMIAKRKNAGNNKSTKPEVMVLEVIGSLMNSACVATSDAKSVYHDRFIEAYLSMLRILKWTVLSFPGASKYADSQLQAFIDGARDKSSVPNLGEFLILFHASSKPESIVTALNAIITEVDCRNVRWFKDPQLKSDAKCENRLGKTFAETEISRTLICFQVAFLKLSRKTGDMTAFVDGMAPEGLIKALKEVHVQVKSQKNWADYFSFVGLKVPTQEERLAQLLDAVRYSDKMGYNGGGGGGKGKGGGGKRR